MVPYVSVKSETGKLKRVMLHRPGHEMEHFVPRQMGEMLFDEIPWLEKMQQEHDAFAAVLRREGAEVVYMEDFLRDIFSVKEVAEAFADELIAHDIHRDRQESRRFKELFMTSRPELKTAYAICGIYNRDIQIRGDGLAEYLPLEKGHLIHPLPNLYFARDSAAACGTGIIPCSMNREARRREAVLMKFILSYHPCFIGTTLLYNIDRNNMPIEGGDILILSDKAVAIGISQRTSLHSVEYVARQILNAHTGFESVLAVHLPDERAFMHLDTVMTMVNQDSFVIYKQVIDGCTVVEMRRGSEFNTTLSYKRHDDLRSGLSSALGMKNVRFIYTAGGDSRMAAREQWNDATNTLCVAPGRVVVYNRNTNTNRVLRAAGIETLEIEGSELVRGRGGPRCMSMPLFRE